MKKLLQNKMLVCLYLFLAVSLGNAQTSVQNFGTGTGSHATATGVTNFLPNPTSGTTYARGGAVVPNAPISLATASNPLGTTDTYVRAAASSSASVAKMSPIVGYTGSTEFYTSFRVLFGNSSAASASLNGIWSFYQGAGGTYTNNNDFANADICASMVFTYGNGVVSLQTRQNTTLTAANLTTTSLTQGVAYTLEFVGNNKSSGTINYNYAGVAQTVAVGRIDIYLDGALIGNDVPKGAMSANSNVASTTFIGVSSTSPANGANIFVDNVTVYNAIPAFINLAPAAIPNAPVVSNATINSLDVVINTNAQNGNGAGIQYAIREAGGDYVQADGSLGATAVWQTAATWGTITVNGLNSNTTYTFSLNARNAANTESGFGATASGTTLENLAANLSLMTPLDDFGGVCINTTEKGSFMFDGANLDGSDIIVNGPAGYSFSLTENGIYTTPLNIPYIGTSIDDQTVWVQFAPTAVQSYDGNIALTGRNLAAAYNVSVTGSGINSAVAVTTGATSGLTAGGATAAGSLVQGCSVVSTYGIEYSTANGFANGSGAQVAASNLSAGAFSSSITGLSANTVYYFKAYATDGTGTVYGNQQTFTTTALSIPESTEATNIQQTQFTANWEAVAGAQSYRLDVSASPTFGTTALATDLFFSEYVEGGGNTKYIEIYNGTGAAVNLSDYELRLFANGDPINDPTTEAALTGTLANGATIVYRNGSATAYVGTTVTNGAINYNGNDAIALYKVSTASFVDIFGTIGQNPGAAWTAGGGYSTLDKTLVRNPDVLGGVTANPGNGFPTLATQWTLFNNNDVSHLGAHAVSNFAPSYIAGYENRTVNGTSEVVSGPEIVAESTYYYRVRAFSANSTSANSDVIEVTTLQAAPTFEAISQVIAVVCDGSDATFNVTGLLADVTSAITFNINNGTPVTVNVLANASGFGTFDYTLVAANSGQTLTVTSVDRVDFPGSPLTVTEDNTVELSVNALVTYYFDFDTDTYGDPTVSITACDGAPAGYVANDTDCDDNEITVNPGAGEIGYNLIDDDCDGFFDEGFPPKVTVVQGPQCGTILSSIDAQIVANIVSGAQGYRWRVTTTTGPSSGQVQEIDTALRVLKLTQLVNYAYGTTYKIEVAVYFTGFLQPFTPSSCTVSTPAITTRLTLCPQNLTNLSNVIYANLVPFASGYRFRVTDPTNGANIQVLERSIREFRMNQITNFVVQYNKQYNVEVAVRNTDGSWLPYGGVCQLMTPAFPTTYVQDSQCEDYQVPNNATQIYAVSYAGAVAYGFQVSGPGLGAPLEVIKGTRSFTLNDFPGLIAGATYNVRVRLVFNPSDAAGPFGKVCRIVTPPLSKMGNVPSTFDVTAYPNPFADNFSINIVTASSEDVNFKVYDMTGRLLDNTVVKAADVATFQAGVSYPSGVYNVIVTQGSDAKTVRLIKR